MCPIRSRNVILNKKTQGFTLIELMIVIAIIGIISAIAIPSYTNYVKQGKAAEATSTLAGLRIQMEQYFQDNRTYVGASCTPINGDKYFTYNCSVGPTPTTYTLQAAGKAAEQMGNFNFTIDQNNAKTSSFDGSPTRNCWVTGKTATC